MIIFRIKLYLIAVLYFFMSAEVYAQNVPEEFKNPPKEFSVLPFWFLNDTLKNEELIRQIADFEKHGVYGFVIHPRMGLPKGLDWMSPELLQYKKVAVDEAAQRNMTVLLYDEGMYPSGSSSGQVVAKNPDFAARGFAKIDLAPGELPQLEEGWKLVTIVERPNGKRMAVIDRPSGGVIRGIHWENEATEKEVLPLAADILNPEAVKCFIELVYDPFAEKFGEHFGKTVLGIFTDEPEPLGRSPKKGMKPGNVNLLPQINEILGYDFTQFFADLWYSEGQDWKQRRIDYERAIAICLEENYYRLLSEWCVNHGVALTGHPAKSMDLGAQKYFDIPGQDLVWRYVVPGKKALEGQHSTMAKNASSAMIHTKRRRNSNEIYGAYGHNLTYEEMVWLANWCFVRGQNMLFPHAFYYSIRGARLNERPPDVGPNAPWWNNYKEYADACSRMCWLNTDSRQVCELAILGDVNFLPDQSAKVCFQHQRDFNYIEVGHLTSDAKVDAEGIHISGMHYKALILDGMTVLSENAIPAIRKLAVNDRLIIWRDSNFASWFPNAIKVNTAEELVAAIDNLIVPDIELQPPSKNIRYRHVVKGDANYYIIFNEEDSQVTTTPKISAKGKHQWLDENTGSLADQASGKPVIFQPHELKILMVK